MLSILRLCSVFLGTSQVSRDKMFVATETGLDLFSDPTRVVIPHEQNHQNETQAETVAHSSVC